MSQHDYVLNDAAGASFRSDLNNALAAIVSQNSGATAPSPTFAYQFWADTTAGILKQRNAANSAWVDLFSLATGLPSGVVSKSGDTMTGALTLSGNPSAALHAAPKQYVDKTSTVRLNTANGYGSTNNKIRRFTNVVLNQGSDITYADSATLGASFTINTSGMYAVSYTDNTTGASGASIGVSLNSSQLTTSIAAITVSDVLAIDNSASASYMGCASGVFYLSSGDVVRAHTDGGATGASQTVFTISRVA